MMRIVHVLQWLEVGGAETVALQLARRQVLDGCAVTLISLSGSSGPMAPTFLGAGVTIIGLDGPSGLDPKLGVRCTAALARLRPHVIHTHDPRSLVYAALPGRALGARVIHTKHGIDIDTPRRKRLIRAASVGLSALIAVSDETAAVAKAGECAAHKVRVIRNGIDTEPQQISRQAARARLGLDPHAWLVGAIGRLEPIKGSDILVEAARDLDADVVLIGDGSLAETLRQTAPPNVHLLGTRTNAAELLPAFDVFVLPSRGEGLPLALLEAMASGRAIVATQVGGVPDALGDTGLLVPPEQPAQLAAAIARYRTDPDLHHHQQHAAKARVQAQYSVHQMAAAYADVYAGR